MPPLRPHLLVMIFLLLALTAGSLPAPTGPTETSAQERTKPDKPQQQSFLSLRDERDALEKDIHEAEKELEALSTTQYWLKEDVALTKESDDKRTTPDRKQQIRRRQEEVRGFAGTPRSLDDVNRDVDQKQKALQDKKRRKDLVETQMNKFLDVEKPKQEFKAQISFYFALLIALVILGFFVVALRDKDVRREIFSGQAGIQFITLFSIVIAIILFGITDVLEGKELAALLGGLSGYILGRTTASSPTGRTAMRPSTPVITAISPDNVTLGAAPVSLPADVVGSGLQLAQSVKLVRGSQEVTVSGVKSSDSAVTFTITADPSLPKGTYDVVVTNSDGSVAKLANAFTVK
jgi:hypothetical protein